jgi:hypothetical protein
VKLVARRQCGRKIVESFDRGAYGCDEPLHRPRT